MNKTKKCTGKCKTEKLFEEFNKGKDKYGLDYWCKECKAECARQNYLDNIEDRLEYARQYHEDNPEYSSEYYLDNREDILEYQKQNYLDNKEHISEYNRLRNLKRNFPPQMEGFKVCTGDCNKKLHITNFKADKNNLDGRCGECRECRNTRDKNRRDTIPEVKIVKNLRARLGKVLKGKSKSDSTLKLLGCTLEYLKQHLESLFTEGMTWDNYGKIKGVVCWEIDHILPCTSFDLNKDKEQQKCFNYTNLQPLWAKDNRSKGSKIG